MRYSATGSASDAPGRPPLRRAGVGAGGAGGTASAAAVASAAVLAAVAGLLASCSASPEGTPVAEPGSEKVLSIRFWQAPAFANPYLSDGWKEVDAGAVTLEPLAKYDPDGNLIPSLAEEIPTIQNGGVKPDLTGITWRLKDDLRWSDGSEMTAEDVVFTWRYCTDEAAACVNHERFADVASVSARDDRTVDITFKHPTTYPYTPFVGSSLSILSRIQFADCVGAAAVSCEADNNAPLGTGPYRIVEFVPYESVVYEPNPHHHGETPYFDRVVLSGGGSADEAARAVLIEGTTDYAWNPQIQPDALREMEAAGKGSVKAAFASYVERLYVNQTNPDPALGSDRSEYLGGANPHPFLTFTPIPQAMSMAIDRQMLSERLYGFAGQPTCSLVTAPANYVSTANDGCLSQDIEGANRLLDDNGVLDTDGDGVREHEGAPLRLTFLTSTNEVRQETQRLLKGWWSEIGIETELIDYDSGVFFGGDRSGEDGPSFVRFFGDVLMFTDATGIDPQQALGEGLCINIPTRQNGWSGRNYARFCNAEYDTTFARLEQTSDPSGREELVRQLNDMIVQNYYLIPLVRRGSVSANLNTLLGVRANAWDSALWNIGEWRRG